MFVIHHSQQYGLDKIVIFSDLNISQRNQRMWRWIYAAKKMVLAVTYIIFVARDV
jgi:hypothetical protein